MRLVFLLLLLINFSCSHTSWGTRDISSTSPINIVLDIDYTIVSPVENLHSDQVVKLENGESFRINNHVLEFIEEMKKHERVNIYFFSGGTRERNIELLSKIKTKSDQSFLDIALDIYSFEDLTQISEIGKFAQKYKKDLKAIGFDLTNTILIDDVPIFSPETQVSNMLWIGKAYYHFEKYTDVIAARSDTKFEQKYIPNSPKEWLRSKNIFSNITQLFKESLEKPETGKSFLETLQARKELYLFPSNKNINCLSSPLYFP